MASHRGCCSTQHGQLGKAHLPNVSAHITEIPTLPFWPETSRFRSIFSRSFCNIPLAKEGNVFSSFTSLFSTILCRFSDVSRAFLPLGHPSTSPRFLGAMMHWIASTSCDVCVRLTKYLYYISLASKYHYQR